MNKNLEIYCIKKTVTKQHTKFTFKKNPLNFYQIADQNTKLKLFYCSLDGGGQRV